MCVCVCVCVCVCASVCVGGGVLCASVCVWCVCVGDVGRGGWGWVLVMYV